MNVLQIDINQHISTIIYDPSPHRISPEEIPVSKRRIPIVYSCENCRDRISFKPENLEKHHKYDFSNLKNSDRSEFKEFTTRNNLEYSFIDFYCPKCGQPTTILFEGNLSGYWGILEFRIKEILILK